MANRHLNNPRMLLKARSVLVAARDLLSDPRRWTQGAMARRTDGEPVDPTSGRAEQWCAVGAINRAAFRMDLPSTERHTIKALACELMQADLELAGVAKSHSVMHVNDSFNGHEQVMRSFSRLIFGATVATLTRRSEAAMKGWETRRRKQREANAAPQPAAPVTMTIAGTLPAATTDANSARLEIVHVQ